MKIQAILVLAISCVFGQTKTSKEAPAVLKKFKFETWEIMLPNDWREKENDSRMVYMESGDKSKGMYFMALSHPDPKSQSSEDTLKALIEGGRRGRESMQGYRWVALAAPKKTIHHDVISYSEDYYDQSKHYLISTLLFVRPGLAARFTFHDYDCANPSRTKSFLKASIQSIKVSGLAP